ncbi:MAG: DUF3047 domain-containing protein [Deltaproteobacteria bacterium]|nr:DUF3047 domain-containing protein [Deltaproteobacteria bacterium]
MHARCLGLLCLCSLVMPSAVRAQPVIEIDAFSRSMDGQFPKGWRTWPTQGGKAREVYKVASEGGNRYLAARDEKEHSVQIFREFGWDLGTHPILTWRWRARTMPSGANETDPATNDSACGVYVIFGKTAGKGLKYVWSSVLPVGKTHSKEAGKMYFTVLDSGQGTDWRTHRVNVTADYRKFFGRAPDKNPAGIGILTDGNATHSPAACDYDNFAIEKE